MDEPKNMPGICPWSSILVLTDGHRHSAPAIKWACAVASADRTCSIAIMHVIDPYLKQFYNEIYAQGRQAYLEHVENEIRKHAEDATRYAQAVAKRFALQPCMITRYGDPFMETVSEVEQGNYDCIVTGGKRMTGIRAFKSLNLPARLADRLKDISVIIIRK